LLIGIETYVDTTPQKAEERELVAQLQLLIPLWLLPCAAAVLPRFAVVVIVPEVEALLARWFFFALLLLFARRAVLRHPHPLERDRERATLREHHPFDRTFGDHQRLRDVLARCERLAGNPRFAVTLVRGEELLTVVVRQRPREIADDVSTQIAKRKPEDRRDAAPVSVVVGTIEIALELLCDRLARAPFINLSAMGDKRLVQNATRAQILAGEFFVRAHD